MQSKQSIQIVLIFISMTINLFAIDGKIKVFISPKEAIYTSQKVTVSVELLSNAFSITDAKITFPASKKYIVQAPQSASYLGREEIEDEDWQMVHYDYDVYALQAGKIEIPPLEVSFTASMGYGQPKKEFELKSEALHFDVRTPEGVKANQFVLVTDDYVLETELKPEKKQLIIGDAVELSITQKAQGVPDILFTPMAYKSDAFLRVYEKEPELQNGLKGKYDVSRTDRVTFVASGEGNVTLPVKERLWWNSMTKKVHIEKTPAYTFEILPDPQIAIDEKKAQQKKLLLYVFSGLFVLVSLYVMFASKIRSYRDERKQIYEASESGKFDTLLASIELGDVHAVDKDLTLWLMAIAPELIRGGLKGIEEIQPSFADVLKAFDLVIIDPERTFNKFAYKEEVNKFRKKLLEENQKKDEGLPKTINPC